MKNNHVLPPCLAGIGLSLIVLTAGMTAAHADAPAVPTVGLSTEALAIGQNETALANRAKPFRLQLGVAFPSDQDISDRVGNTFLSGGLGYDFHTSARNNAGIYGDFFSRDNTGNKLSVFGLGVQERHYFAEPHRNIRPYVGAGLGIYDLRYRLDGTDDDKVGLGGKALLGVETHSGVFLEANYTAAETIRDVQPGGAMLQVGYHF